MICRNKEDRAIKHIRSRMKYISGIDQNPSLLCPKLYTWHHHKPHLPNFDTKTKGQKIDEPQHH